MDCRNGLCTAEAGRCLLRTLPRMPQVPYAAGPWAGKTAFEIPILYPLRSIRHHSLVHLNDLPFADGSAVTEPGVKVLPAFHASNCG